MRVEHSRKHGPFDSRYPPIGHKPTPASLWRLGEEHLDWQGFLGRFSPDSRRHDFDALAAYESYLNDAHGRPADGFPASAPASSPAAVHNDRSDKTHRSEDWEKLPATAHTERWVGDSGASTGSPRDHDGVSDVSERTRFSHDRSPWLDHSARCQLFSPDVHPCSEST